MQKYTSHEKKRKKIDEIFADIKKVRTFALFQIS